MRSAPACVAIAIALAACVERPQPLLVCHNANCAPGASAALDDTMLGLEASLALPEGAFDGIEIDLLWRDGRCVFAHDASTPDPVDARVAADRIAASGRAGVLWVELKVADGTPPAELAACAVDAIARIAPAELVVSSFSAELLAAAAAHPAWPGGELVAELVAPGRMRLDEFRISGVSVDPFQVDAATLARYRDLSYQVALWADAVTPELFAWIERARPRWVSVAEVALVRAWLDG
jgi:hypothetical protein